MLLTNEHCSFDAQHVRGSFVTTLWIKYQPPKSLYKLEVKDKIKQLMKLFASLLNWP